MAREIELKIRLAHPEPFLTKLASVAELLGPYAKDDTYFKGPAGSFRLRQDKGLSVVCRKEKTISHGIETSRETEFVVDAPPAFVDFAASLGYREWYRKSKNGNAWQWNDILIEEGTVSNLGWFAEFEILLDDGTDLASVESARLSLLAAIEALGVGREAVEGRPYSQLLGHRGR